ncbi:MAG: hypothetical protein ACO3SO_05560 [Luteolibacter sp.]
MKVRIFAILLPEIFGSCRFADFQPVQVRLHKIRQSDGVWLSVLQVAAGKLIGTASGKHVEEKEKKKRILVTFGS